MKLKFETICENCGKPSMKKELIKIKIFGINYNVCNNCYDLCKKFEEIHK